MAGYINKVQIMGNLGAEPEVRHTQDGKKVVSLRIATSKFWKDKSTGEKREKTEWHTVVIFNERLGQIAEKFLKKGSKVYIEGQLQTREWEDKTATKRKSTEIVLQNFEGEIMLMDSKSGDKDSGNDDSFGLSLSTQSDQNAHPMPSFGQVRGAGADILDDDIPF